jgi:hypothetical protein
MRNDTAQNGGVRSTMVQESKIKTIDARSKNFKLVGGLEHFLFSVIYGIILPIDELIFFKMVTTNQ